MRNNKQRLDIPNVFGHHCFACGTHNPVGLKMRFYLENGWVCSDVSLGEHHVGWETLAHGGLISTLLDEVMGWAVLAMVRRFVVTKKMEVRYLRPVHVNEPLRVCAQIANQDVGGCMVRSVLRAADGLKSARALADMAFLPERRVKMLPADFRRETEAVFRQMERLMARHQEIS